MVAHLLKLRLLLLANGLRRSTWQVVGLVIGLLYGLGFLVIAMIGLVALSFAPLDVARSVVVLGGAVAVLAWLLLPVLLAGVDQTLDPARLVAYPIPMRQLLPGLALAGVVGVPGIVTLLASLATVGTWIRTPGAAAAALVCAVVATATCVVGSRAVAAFSAGRSGRRLREITGVLILVPLFLLGPVIAGVATSVEASAAALPVVTEVVSWTPLGAVWAVPAEIAAGAGLAAAAKTLIALATLGGLVVLWRRFLAASLVTPPHAETSRAQHGLGLLGRLPATPVGAVAARCLIYWFRDPRYLRQLIFIPLIPALFSFNASTTGVTGFLEASAPFLAFLLSMAIYSDVSLDNTAFATHVSAGLRGRDDRAGRVIAVSAFAVPVVVVVALLAAAVSDGWERLPALLGIAFSVFGAGVGAASIVSARVVFPAPLPGDSPFKTPQGAGAASIAASFATMGIVLVLGLPALVLGIVAIATGSLLLGSVTLVVGSALGVLFALVGIRRGGDLLDRRAPDLLQQLMRHR